MESDELRHLEQLGFDERSETWFIDTSEKPRLALTRSTLTAMVQLYNRIHRGNPLLLADQRSFRSSRDENTAAEPAPRCARQPDDPRRSRGGACRLLRLIKRSLLWARRRRSP